MSEAGKRSYYKHREKNLVRRKEYQKKYPEKVREYWMKNRYNLTVSEFNLLLKNQQNRCAICFKVFDKTPNIDHDHTTGHIRGLLCRECNLGISYFCDDIEILNRASQYIAAGKRRKT